MQSDYRVRPNIGRLNSHQDRIGPVTTNQITLFFFGIVRRVVHHLEFVWFIVPDKNMTLAVTRPNTIQEYCTVLCPKAQHWPGCRSSGQRLVGRGKAWTK